jgi:hypothetical protein
LGILPLRSIEPAVCRGIPRGCRRLYTEGRLRCAEAEPQLKEIVVVRATLPEPRLGRAVGLTYPGDLQQAGGRRSNIEPGSALGLGEPSQTLLGLGQLLLVTAPKPEGLGF